MNSVIGQVLGCSKYNRKTDNKECYTIRLLCENRVIVMFYNDKSLYDSLSKLDRLSDIQLFGDLIIKDESSFRFVPKSFEM